MKFWTLNGFCIGLPTDNYDVKLHFEVNKFSLYKPCYLEPSAVHRFTQHYIIIGTNNHSRLSLSTCLCLSVCLCIKPCYPAPGAVHRFTQHYIIIGTTITPVCLPPPVCLFIIPSRALVTTNLAVVLCRWSMRMSRLWRTDCESYN